MQRSFTPCAPCAGNEVLEGQPRQVYRQFGQAVHELDMRTVHETFVRYPKTAEGYAETAAKHSNIDDLAPQIFACVQALCAGECTRPPELPTKVVKNSDYL